MKKREGKAVNLSGLIAAVEAALPELALKSAEAGLEITSVTLSFGQVSLSVDVTATEDAEEISVQEE